MKVIDLDLYRSTRKLSDLEKKVGTLLSESKPGIIREMKLTFKQWLLLNYP